MIYAISDLHLSLGVKDKPMNIFGDKWDNYEEKIKEDWLNKVTPNDTVIISGDFSWATYLEEAVEDFRFINELPGKKYILKGNHDYWWTTVKKMNEFINLNGFKNIFFLHSNAYDVGDFILAGTRYWDYDDEMLDNEKIFNRELIRAEISLNLAKEIDTEKKIIFMTHYPPDEKIAELAKKYNIKIWIYGHIHSNYEENIVNVDGVDTYLTTCDYLDFKLKKIY